MIVNHDETGDHRPASQVDHLRSRTGQGPDLTIAPGSQNLLVPDRHSLSDRSNIGTEGFIVYRDNLGVVDNAVGMAL